MFGFFRPIVTSHATWDRNHRIDIGDIVLYGRADGFLTHDHLYIWIGRVESFEMKKVLGVPNHEEDFAIVQIVKRLLIDNLDRPLTPYPISLENRSLQWIDEGFWSYMK